MGVFHIVKIAVVYILISGAVICATVEKETVKTIGYIKTNIEYAPVFNPTDKTSGVEICL